MLIRCFIYILKQCVISSLFCVLGFIFIFYFQDKNTAKEFLKTWIIYFNGILVWGFGWGLFEFIRKENVNFFANLKTLCQIPDKHSKNILLIHKQSTSLKHTAIFTIPLTIIGGIVLWNCTFPLSGFAKIYLAFFTILIYFVASFELAFFYYFFKLFNYFEINYTDITTNENRSIIEIEEFNMFFIITSTVGIICIYLGFRGTLTANFIFYNELFKKFLVLPLVFYLPATLIYSFYPRYVLKKINNYEIIKKIKDLDSNAKKIINNYSSKKNDIISLKEKIDFEDSILNLKEKLLNDNRGNSLISFKDSPSLIITLIMIIQLITSKDEIIKNFLNYLFST